MYRIYHHSKFELKLFKNVQMYTNFFDAVSKKSNYFPRVHKPCSKTKLLHYLTKFHPIQLKSVQENEANRFCFVLTLWPQAKIKFTTTK